MKMTCRGAHSQKKGALSTEPQINRYFTAKICAAKRRNETANCRDAMLRVSNYK
ncbi:MAG: hypothetical protein VSS75_014780 [Candidatus Parabeggiatoa sp.]